VTGKSSVDLERDPRSIIGTRVFDAPRALAFQAFTDPKHLAEWWGPTGFTTTTHAFDFRPGGVWRFVMHGPDGRDYQNRVTYDGLARHPMAPTWPLQMLSTFTFDEVGGKTKFTVRWSPYEATEEERKTFDAGHDSMTMGWSGTMEQFAAYLATTK
jgi:uncharacterized protein YndB with AHSA1/START domain